MLCSYIIYCFNMKNLSVMLYYNVLTTDETISTRLLGNPIEQAIVQVWNGSSWGRICVDSWSLEYATLTCQQAGYGYAIQALSIPIEDDYSDGQMEVYLNLRPSETCITVSALNFNEFSCRDTITANCECQQYQAGVQCSMYSSYHYMYVPL